MAALADLTRCFGPRAGIESSAGESSRYCNLRVDNKDDINNTISQLDGWDSVRGSHCALENRIFVVVGYTVALSIPSSKMSALFCR